MSIVASASEDENPDGHARLEHESRGGDLGNTHLANRQGGLETGGEDTAEIGLGVFWSVPEGSTDSFLVALDSAKEQAQALKMPVLLEWNGLKLAVSSRGWGSGGGRGVYYDFRTETCGIKLSIACQHGPREHRANVRVEIGAVTLMKFRGLRGAWAHAVAVIEGLGGVVLWNKLARIDFCIDVPGLDVGTVVDMVKTGLTVTRVRRYQYHENGRRWTGVTIAPGSPTLLRVYDKALEVYISKPNPEKARLLEGLRWGGSVIHATRLEWQLRRSVLTSFGISSVEDYLAFRTGVMLNLMTRWFRLTLHPPDRENNNTQRAETHPLWEKFIEYFQGWMGPGDTPAERIDARPFIWPARDAKQALGCLLRVLAYEKAGEVIDGPEIRDALHASLETVLDTVANSDLIRRYEAKALLVVVQVV